MCDAQACPDVVAGRCTFYDEGTAGVMQIDIQEGGELSTTPTARHVCERRDCHGMLARRELRLVCGNQLVAGVAVEITTTTIERQLPASGDCIFMCGKEEVRLPGRRVLAPGTELLSHEIVANPGECLQEMIALGHDLWLVEQR